MQGRLDRALLAALLPVLEAGLPELPVGSVASVVKAYSSVDLYSEKLMEAAADLLVDNIHECR